MCSFLSSDTNLMLEASKRNSYVIFICKFDPFGCGDKVYHLETVCRKRPNMQIEDGRYTMFLNTKGTLGESYPDLDALFKYINGGVDSIGNETGSPLEDRLDGYVVELNRSQEWRRERMKYELNLEERYREGRVDGLSQGVATEKNANGKELEGTRCPFGCYRQSLVSKRG